MKNVLILLLFRALEKNVFLLLFLHFLGFVSAAANMAASLAAAALHSLQPDTVEK